MSKSKIKFYIFYLLIVSIFITLSLEALIRIFEISPKITNQYANNIQDRNSLILPKPNSSYTSRSKSKEFKFNYSHNSLGFRDIEHSYSKPNDTFRILGLGDSFTYGVGASFENSYLYQLEEMLSNRKNSRPKVEIIKAGIYRYFPEAERLLLQHYGIKFKPDLIIVAFAPNDVQDTFLGLDAVTVKENGYLITREANELGEFCTRVYFKSHLFRIIIQKYISYKSKFLPDGEKKYNPDKHKDLVWNKILSEYEKMIKLAKQINAEIVFIHIPQKGPWNKENSYPSQTLSKWSSTHNVKFIDLLPAIKEASRDKNLYWQIDGHPNEEGYDTIAKILYTKLIKFNLVP